MNKELTYILGAGASFESIPIVKSFPERFQKFNDYLQRVNLDSRLSINIRESFKIVHEKSKILLESFKAHQSFDTYFKKLFHTNQEQKICLAKKILNLYFLWEHLSKPSAKPQDYTETVFWKQSSFDKRYDALIAGLLKPINGKAEPYCPINFITWNYDLNLFLSLKNYFSPNENIGNFLKRIKSNQAGSIWKLNERVTVLNMNGFFYSELFSDENDLSSINIEPYDIIEKKLNADYFSDDYIDNDAVLIRFAWESHSQQESVMPDVIRVASEKMLMSENIVVIGYTFPLYNRLVDFDFFNRSRLKKKIIYIQDPNANRLAKSIASDFNIDTNTSSFTTLIEETNCDSFLIPSNIYKYKDSISDI